MKYLHRNGDKWERNKQNYVIKEFILYYEEGFHISEGKDALFINGAEKMNYPVEQ